MSDVRQPLSGALQIGFIPLADAAPLLIAVDKGFVAAEGIETLKTAPRAPWMNAHCERVIGTLRREALDHLLIWNQTHARRVLAAYAHHYNQHRPHQARSQLPPLAEEHPAPVTDLTSHRLLRMGVLGGVVNEYRYAA